MQSLLSLYETTDDRGKIFTLQINMKMLRSSKDISIFFFQKFQGLRM